MISLIQLIEANKQAIAALTKKNADLTESAKADLETADDLQTQLNAANDSIKEIQSQNDILQKFVTDAATMLNVPQA